MANYCYNRLNFSSVKDLEKVLDENGHFDLNNFLPAPTSPENCPPKFLLDNPTPNHFMNECDWRRENWGTSWIDNVDMSNTTIWFVSAWEPPIEYYKALAEEYPEMDFNASYCEEGFLSFAGEIFSKKDGTIDVFEYNDNEDAMAELYFELVGCEEDYFKDENGNWRYIEDETSFYDEIEEKYIYLDFTDADEVIGRIDEPVVQRIISKLYTSGEKFENYWDSDKYNCEVLELD